MLADLALQVPLSRAIVLLSLSLIPCRVQTLLVRLDGEVSLEAGYRADVDEIHIFLKKNIIELTFLRHLGRYP